MGNNNFSNHFKQINKETNDVLLPTPLVPKPTFFKVGGVIKTLIITFSFHTHPLILIYECNRIIA